MTPEREGLLEAVTDVVCRRGEGRSLVAVDGRSGAGKSTFADELADRLGRRDVWVVRSTTDSFHRPRGERLARGLTSAEGFYLDSYQLDVIVGDLLEPFTRGRSRVRVAAFDEPSDSPVDESVVVDPDAVLLFDGLFLHRPELDAYWTTTIFLEADKRCDQAWLDYLLGDLPADVEQHAAEIDARLRRAPSRSFSGLSISPSMTPRWLVVVAGCRVQPAVADGLMFVGGAGAYGGLRAVVYFGTQDGRLFADTPAAF